jgi:hypothetical protein
VSIREQVQLELDACSNDPSRDIMKLRMLLEDFATRAGFDPFEDGLVENDVIRFLVRREGTS